MQALFYNNAYNIEGFNSSIQAMKNKYEGKNGFIQWLYSGLKNNINTIS